MRKGSPYLVVGAGYQGLTFALEAARRGLPVVLLEKSARVGGMARSFTHEGFTCDFGMHGFISQDRRLTGMMKDLLGANFSAFRVRPASWFGPGDIVEDRRFFPDRARYPYPHLFTGTSRRLETEVWNCMRIYNPPTAIYPKKGGFGRVFEDMAAEIRRRGGRILLGSSLAAGDLKVSGGRVVSARLRGRWTAVAGCYWAAGAQRVADPNSRLLLYHFFLKGRTPSPYHWVRIALENPLVPPLVYYPSNFSRANAPRGCYSVAAALPVYQARANAPRDKKRLLDWFSRSPEDFQPWLTRFLSRAGFFPEKNLLGVRQDSIPLPQDRFGRKRFKKRDGLRAVRASNFWEADDWLKEIPGDSWMPSMMRSALRAAEDVLPAAAERR